MKLVLLVNRAQRVKVDQSTALMMAKAAERGWDVAVLGIGELEVGPDGAASGWCLSVPPVGDLTPTRWMQKIRVSAATRRPLTDFDALVVRTNPARDPSRAGLHDAAMGICRIARDAGLVVLSDPDGLAGASSKLYVSRLPESVRPTTLVSRKPAEIEAFVRSRPGRTILKPLSGTQGTDVFRVEPDEPANLRQIIDVLVRQGYAMAQDWIPDATKGDVRLLVLKGELLEVDGEVAAVRRVPAEGEIRSNVHRGGSPARAARVQVFFDVVEAVRPRLQADGLFLVGIDLIGDRIVEVNVFSPGGIGDAGAFAGVDFMAAILDAIQAEVQG